MSSWRQELKGCNDSDRKHKSYWEMTSIWVQKAVDGSVFKLSQYCTQSGQSHKPWKFREVSEIMSSSPGADTASKCRGGDFRSIWQSSLITGLFCKSVEIYFTTLLWQKTGRQNDLISRLLFSELYIIVVKKVTFVGFREDRPNLPPSIRTSLINPMTILVPHQAFTPTFYNKIAK